MKSLSKLTPAFAITAAAALLVSCGEEEAPAPEVEEKTSAAAAEPAREEEEGHGEERIKHLQVPDVTNMADAKRIFLERTAEITGKEELDNNTLHEIHMSTYHLETAVAFFAENFKGPKKKSAEKIAVVVEEIHLSSEGFKPDEARKHIDQFSKLAEKFAAEL